MVKVKIQTSPSGTFPTAFGPALAAMQANRAETRFPFGSLVPLWGRQVSLIGASAIDVIVLLVGFETTQVFLF